MKHLLLAGAAILGLSYAAPARADLFIYRDGTQIATSAANSNLSANGSAGGITYNVSLFGIDILGASGAVQDVAAQITGTGSITFDFVQTNLASPADILGIDLRFLGTLLGESVTRAIYFDAANTGAAATLLGSVTTGGTSDILTSVPVTGSFYSLRETITFQVTSATFLSSDDLVKVPEPATIALLGAGLLGLAGLRRRRD